MSQAAALLNDLGGAAGVVAFVGFVVRELIARRARNAAAEVTELTADKMRVDMADGIAKSLQLQLDLAEAKTKVLEDKVEKLQALVEKLTTELRAKTNQLLLMEDQQEVDRRKIFALERAIIDSGGHLPYEIFDES